mmetsp:Transcript_61095/g.177094  ORF Transcript_61095/g.177094 Transcript_61095/m.177094 type:complete len:222 (-) Transcript_61095:1251-1916(-)
MRLSRSVWAFDNESLSCSKYCRWLSSRASTSVRRSWRVRSSPSNFAFCNFNAWLDSSLSALALETAPSKSLTFCFDASRSASRRVMAESRCWSNVSFSSNWLCATFSAELRDCISASSACCRRSNSCLWATRVRSSCSPASSKSFLRVSRSCWCRPTSSSASSSRWRRSATWPRKLSCWRLWRSCSSAWSSVKLESLASKRLWRSAASASPRWAASTSDFA